LFTEIVSRSYKLVVL